MKKLVKDAIYYVLIVGTMAGCLFGYQSCVGDYYEDGYKQGQIDAVNGEIRYGLVEQDDGETLWQRIR